MRNAFNELKATLLFVAAVVLNFLALIALFGYYESTLLGFLGTAFGIVVVVADCLFAMWLDEYFKNKHNTNNK